MGERSAKRHGGLKARCVARLRRAVERMNERRRGLRSSESTVCPRQLHAFNERERTPACQMLIEMRGSDERRYSVKGGHGEPEAERTVLSGLADAPCPRLALLLY